MRTVSLCGTVLLLLIVSHAKTAGDSVPLQGPDVSRLVPPDLTFATAFVQSLSDSGWDVQAVRHSKFNGGLFGTTKAAWVKTDKGILEVVFFEKADEVEQIQIREEQDSTASRHRYTVTCATGNHPWEGRLPVYFTKHGILLIISHDRELADLLIPTNLSLTSLAPTSDESTPKQKESQEKETQSIPSSDKNAKAGCFRESDPPALVQEKRNWKSFSPDADLVVDLPDNVCTSGGGFIAASEGVMYSISTMERPQISLSPDVIDRVLNTLARTFAGFRSRTWVDNGPANSFEIKLLRKEEVNGQPGKVYRYTLASCSERKGGEFLK